MAQDSTNPPGSIEGREPIGATSAGLALMTAALWGGTPVAISYSVDTLPPIATAGLRFALASVFMVFWCRWESTELRLRAGQLKPALVAGVLLFVQIGLFHYGIQQSNSSHGSLLINTFVIWVVAIDHFITKSDRLTTWRTLGLALAASGVALVLTTTSAPGSLHSTAGENDVPSLTGDLILLTSAFLLGVKIVYTKHALRTVEPSKLIFWHDVVGMALLAVYSASFEQTAVNDFSTPAVCGLLYQGLVVAGFCFAVQTRLLRRHSASRLSVFAFSTPLFGLTFAFLFRGDPLSPWLAVSAACVATGILMVNLPPAATTRPQ